MLSASLLALSFAATDRQPPSLWPAPSTSTPSTKALPVTPSKSFFKLAGDHSGKSSPLLTAAFERYLPLTFPHTADADASPNLALSVLTITVDDLSEDHPGISTDESYTIDVSYGAKATAHAKTVYGALRALETFSQMVTFDFDAGLYEIIGAPWKVDDTPRFAHRGLMIDTARHYETLAAIRGVVDSLPYAKLNVLHWHMVDIQSFPFESKTSPKLWEGAYAPSQRYTQADVASIVEYARLRGVRVMVEFDMPGHAQSWCTGYPEICPSTDCLMPLNVANNETFDRIEKLMGECTGGAASQPGKPSGLFPDGFIHLVSRQHVA